MKLVFGFFDVQWVIKGGNRLMGSAHEGEAGQNSRPRRRRRPRKT